MFVAPRPMGNTRLCALIKQTSMKGKRNSDIRLESFAMTKVRVRNCTGSVVNERKTARPFFGKTNRQNDQNSIKTANSERAALHFDKTNIYIHVDAIKRNSDIR
jgi:hypothetical protein